MGSKTLLQSGFSRTKYFKSHISGTNLKWKDRVTVEGKWPLQVRCLALQLSEVLPGFATSGETLTFMGL